MFGMIQVTGGFPKKEKIYILILLLLLSVLLSLMTGKEIQERKLAELQEPERPAIAAIGDSLTEGYGVKNSYTEILSKYLRTDVKNCGVGGIRISEISSNIDSCIEEDTDIVIFWGGANDLKYPTPLEDMIKEFNFALAQLSEKKVIVLTIPPNIELDEDSQETRKKFNNYILSLENITVLDIYDVLKDPENENLMREEYHLRGVHLNQEGYYVVANMVFREIVQTFH